MIDEQAIPELKERDTEKPAGHANRWVMAVLLLGVIGGTAWYFRAKSQSQATQATATAASADAKAVPVTVASVIKADIPLSIDGLGSVTPLSTVSVRSQVDGKLEHVGFKEGQFVHKGEVLANIDARPFIIQLHMAEAAIARDAATARNAKLNLERYKTLRQQNLVPEQQVTDQQAALDLADAVVKGDEATAENARLQIDYARVTSPIDGVTGVRQIDPGNLVHSATDATGIVILTQLDPISVIFTLPEDELPRISQQMALGPIAVEAYARDGTTKLATGELALIDNQINQATATIRLKAIFPNPKNALWPNQFVKARLLLTTRKNALVVPAAVIQRGPQGMFAYVVGPDKTVSMRSVEVDATVGEQAIIAKGLEPDEVVVSDGQAALRPGSKVSPRTSRSGAVSATAAGASAVPPGAPPPATAPSATRPAP